METLKKITIAKLVREAAAGRTDFRYCDFSGKNIDTRGDFRNIDFEGSSFENARIFRTWFIGCNFKNCNFKNSLVHDVLLDGSDLTNTDWTDSNHFDFSYIETIFNNTINLNFKKIVPHTSYNLPNEYCRQEEIKRLYDKWS